MICELTRDATDVGEFTQRREEREHAGRHWITQDIERHKPSWHADEQHTGLNPDEEETGADATDRGNRCDVGIFSLMMTKPTRQHFRPAVGGSSMQVAWTKHRTD